MTTAENTDEMRARRAAALGQAAGELFDDLCHEVTWLHAKWLEFSQLYCASRARVQVLNESAPFFFSVVQRTLLDDIVLHIARLTDPPRSRGKLNLTLRRLEEALAGGSLEDQIRELMSVALMAAGFAKDQRNRRLAHLDPEILHSRGAAPLPRASREQIEGALKAFRDLLNVVHVEYVGSYFGFEHVRAFGDARALLGRLREAHRYGAGRLNRLRSGGAIPEDLALRERL